MIAALLHKGTCYLQNTGNSNDEQSALSAIRALGAKIEQSGDKILVNSHGIKPIQELVNIGESGFSARVFTSLLGAVGEPMVINGTGSVLHRKMDFFKLELPQLGIKIEDNEGRLPIHITGPASIKSISVDSRGSSQYISGLLFLFSYLCGEEVKLDVRNPISRPYIDMTIDIIHTFHLAKIDVQNENTFLISPVSNEDGVSPIHYTIENDWSNAALLLAACCMHPDLSVTGLDADSHQGDKKILDAIHECGAKAFWSDDLLKISGDLSRSVEFDANHCPDLFPALAMIGLENRGTLNVNGANRLANKESDRSATIRKAILCMGGNITFVGDMMQINGRQQLLGGVVNPYNDHRIAMMAGLLATKAEYPTIILNANCVNKSFPEFWEELKKVGAHIEFYGA